MNMVQHSHETPGDLKMRSIRIVGIAVLAALGAAACHGKQPEAAPVAAPAPPPASTRSADDANQVRIRDSIARARAAETALQRAKDDSIARVNATARDQAGMRVALTSMIHFDFDKSDLREDAKAILDAKIPILLANPGVAVRIAGHTDEKGSTEYNFALGQRRAAMAKRYLMEHGVATGRIETVSYGMERPVAQGKDDAASAQNRRDEFEITAGGSGPLNKPRP
jgi:peptidoglycan-associated lipoprotein